MQHSTVALMKMLQKHSKQKNLIDIFKRMKPFVQRFIDMDLRDQIIYNIQYLLHIVDAKDVDQALDELVLDAPNQFKGEIMSIAEKLEQRGIQKGVQQGVQQGMQREKEEVAKKLIASGQSLEFVMQMTGLNHALLKTL